MSASRKRGVNCVSLGEPPPTMLKDVDTVKFVIHKFNDRQEKQGKSFDSPPAKAHGYDWKIRVYPRGDRTSSTDQECISCYLVLCAQKDVTAICSFRCKGFEKRLSEPRIFNNSKGVGFDFLERNRVIAYCLEKDGSFVIECNIRIAAKNNSVWYPKELQQQDILVDLYRNASSETSDVVFSVEEAHFRAHKNILSLRSKKLYEIAKESENVDAPIPIHSVRAETFKGVLDFAYSVKTPEIKNEVSATDFLVAADRYDCVHLKLYVESIIVDNFLTAGNAAAWLIFADSYSCALLKEAATNLFVTDAGTVKNSEAWSQIEESRRLVTELLNSLVCSKTGVNDTAASEIDRMDVTALREELGVANLQLDGSREVLINRLCTHRQHQDQDQDSEK